MKAQPQFKRNMIGLVTAAVVSVALTACGGDKSASATAAGGSVASGIDLKGVNITVGSKEYTEQKVLGQIIVQALKATGANVKDQTGLNGTRVARAALTSGQIDTYYEYTGTGWLTILQKTQPINDAQQLFTAVRDADAKNKISWFALAPMNDTYAVGITADAAKSTGVKTISQYAELARTDPAKAKICSSAEFATREDGLPGLEKKYGFTLPESSIFQAESTVEFQAAKKGECNFLRLDSTDARILKNGTIALTDDKNFFPVYNPAVTMRTDVYTAHQAQYDKLFDAVSKLLTQDAILKLNAAVELDGLPADKVALDFLKTNGIV
jgi:osmoprotectant transport system substrate-binding protein